METSTFRISGAEHILCHWIKMSGPYIYADPIRLHIPKTAIQRTRFPQTILEDVIEISLGKPANGEERIVLLESVPTHYNSLTIRSEFCILLSLFEEGLKERQYRAQITFFTCRLADYLDSVSQFLINAYVNRQLTTDFDIACFELEFQQEIQSLYQDIYDYPPCVNQQSLLGWCASAKEYMYRPFGDMDAILNSTHILAHNARCLGTGQWKQLVLAV